MEIFRRTDSTGDTLSVREGVHEGSRIVRADATEVSDWAEVLLTPDQVVKLAEALMPAGVKPEQVGEDAYLTYSVGDLEISLSGSTPQEMARAIAIILDAQQQENAGEAVEATRLHVLATILGVEPQGVIAAVEQQREEIDALKKITASQDELLDSARAKLNELQKVDRDQRTKISTLQRDLQRATGRVAELESLKADRLGLDELRNVLKTHGLRSLAAESPAEMARRMDGLGRENNQLRNQVAELEGVLDQRDAARRALVALRAEFIDPDSARPVATSLDAAQATEIVAWINKALDATA